MPGKHWINVKNNVALCLIIGAHSFLYYIENKFTHDDKKQGFVDDSLMMGQKCIDPN